MTIKIDLPESHVVTKGPRDKSWNASVTVKLSDLSPDIIARLAVHGLHQKIADAAAGSQTLDEASADMAKALKALVAGEWTQRTAGAGVDERTIVQRSVTKAAAKASMGAKSPEWATFTGLSDDAQAEKLDAWFVEHEAALSAAVEDELAARQAKRDRKASLAGKVSFGL